MTTANIRVLIGHDTFRMKERVAAFTTAFGQKYPEGSTEKWTRAEPLSTLQNTLQTGSLFGGKRLVIIEDFAEEWDALKPLIESAAGDESVSVIIAYGAPDKRVKAYKALTKGTWPLETFDTLKPRDAADWAVRRFPGLSFAAAEYLINRVDGDLWRAAKEIEKLQTHGGEITKELINQLTHATENEEIWGALRAFSARKNGALQHYRAVRKSGASPHMILSMLMREVRILTQINAAKAENRPVSATGLSSFVLRQSAPLADGWTLEELKAAYGKLAHIDISIKTGQIRTTTADESELDVMIETFIVAPC